MPGSVGRAQDTSQAAATSTIDPRERCHIRTSARPRANRRPVGDAHAERFVGSIRAECLDRLICFGERRLLRALDEFVAHYHRERNHQGLGSNELITAQTRPLWGTHVRCRERLGGLLRY
jgi:transposase InsO family protein